MIMRHFNERSAQESLEEDIQYSTLSVSHLETKIMHAIRDLKTGELPKIEEFYQNEDIFITGASGFIGKLLVEKLLRTCPDVGTLFLLMRPKRDKTPEHRLQMLWGDLLFRRLREERPDALSKLRVVAGDIGQLGLGLAEEDALMLRERVGIVFHLAASVRFDDPLQTAVFMNTRGTREMCEIARSMKKLKVFLHISTTFSTALRTVEEHLYQPPGYWREHIFAAENMDQSALNILTRTLLGDSMNTYVFTKAMAEHIVDGYGSKIPVAVVRPSVVVNTAREPIMGWNDNVNGPIAWSLGVMAGIVHQNPNSKTGALDVIPADVLINGLLVAAAMRGFQRSLEETPVYNATVHQNRKLKYDELRTVGELSLYENPTKRIYKAYHFRVESLFLFNLLYLLQDVPIAALLDGVSKAFGLKTRFLKLHRLLIVAVAATVGFANIPRIFVNSKFDKLWECVHPEDKAIFFGLEEEPCAIQHVRFSSKMTREIFLNDKKGDYYLLESILSAVHCCVCGILAVFMWKLGVLEAVVKVILSVLGILLFF